MKRFERPVRIRFRSTILVAGFVFLTAQPASARLHDLAPRFDSEYVTAIHRPTGCSAVLEFTNKVLVGAFITDPLCLPHGVRARAIPAFPRDFHVPASKRQLLRVR